MNREILFRGKRTDNGEWTQGYLFRIWEKAYICWGTVNDIPDMKEVDPETVCQYTGLIDKNGRKIFEGDICKTHYANAKINGFVETIVFNSGRFYAFQGRDGCKSWAALYDGVPHLSIDKSVYMDEIEVIGNIFDNPELLEGNHAAGD